ncbi:hypothetical protein WA026_019628 [Henosepilachna vigintioctopunctata]|uniref:Uncharacterized protein n=1 Tax=Henosepilachna vigintioctopunctata TaxID=420089 RepID=A0AAW1TXF7_9CUCU
MFSGRICSKLSNIGTSNPVQENSLQFEEEETPVKWIFFFNNDESSLSLSTEKIVGAMNTIAEVTDKLAEIIESVSLDFRGRHETKNLQKRRSCWKTSKK